MTHIRNPLHRVSAGLAVRPRLILDVARESDSASKRVTGGWDIITLEARAEFVVNLLVGISSISGGDERKLRRVVVVGCVGTGSGG